MQRDAGYGGSVWGEGPTADLWTAGGGSSSEAYPIDERGPQP